MKYQNQRKGKRFDVKNGVALTPSGICKVCNLNKDGLSLKSYIEQKFPEEWQMDIHDTEGFSLQEIKVKKIWERKSGDPRISNRSEVEVGGKFENLTSSQEAHLISYLYKLMEEEMSI